MSANKNPPDEWVADMARQIVEEEPSSYGECPPAVRDMRAALASGRVGAAPESMLAYALAGTGEGPMESAQAPIRAAELFDSVAAGDRSVLDEVGLRLIAAPGEALPPRLPAGALLVTRALGEGSLAHVAMLRDGEHTCESSVRRGGLPADSLVPGRYVEVIDAVSSRRFPGHRFARRIGSPEGTLDLDRLIVEPKRNTSLNEDAGTHSETAVPREDVEPPALSTSARLEWVNLEEAGGSDGATHLYYVTTGAPDGGPAQFHLKVTNTNSVYNFQNVRVKLRLRKPRRDGSSTVIRLGGATADWKVISESDLSDESDQTYRYQIDRATLRRAYDPDSPLTVLDVEFHWAEHHVAGWSQYYARGRSLEFYLVNPIEYLFSRKTFLREVSLSDLAQHRDYLVFLTGIRYTREMRDPVSLSLAVSTRVSQSDQSSSTQSQGTSQSQTQASSTSGTFNVSVSGEMSQGGSAQASIEVLELGLQRMFKLGSTIGFSRTTTRSLSDTQAREFAQSVTASRSYVRENARTQSFGIQIRPQPVGTTLRPYLYPQVAYYAVPYVRFTGINSRGQATRRVAPQEPVAVPYLNNWTLTTTREGPPYPRPRPRTAPPPDPRCEPEPGRQGG